MTRSAISVVITGLVASATALALVGCAPDPAQETELSENLLSGLQSSMEVTSNEAGEVGWLTQGNAAIEVTSAAAAEGTKALKVEPSADDAVFVDDTRNVRIATAPSVAVEPGAQYAGRIQIAASSTTTSSARCELRWYGPDGQIVDTVTDAAPITVSEEWSTAECRGSAPEGAVNAALRVHFAEVGPVDVYYVDDASLVSSTVRTDPEVTRPAPSAPAVVAPPSSSRPPAVVVPSTVPGGPEPTVPAGGMPTASSTGPRVANPENVGRIEVRAGEKVELTDVVAHIIKVYPGGELVARNVSVTASVHVLAYVGQPAPKLHMYDSSVNKGGMTVHAHDANGSLYWGGEVPVDVVVSGSYIRREQGALPDHTNALKGFGWPRGAKFLGTTFVQQGPYNHSQTASVNWHGADTVFDGSWFVWETDTAAYYTVHIEGRNNVVRNSHFERGLASYVYPSSSPQATYSDNVDLVTGAALS